MINSFSPTAFISSNTYDSLYANALNITEIIAALRSGHYTDDQIVEYLCGHCYTAFAEALVGSDYTVFLNDLNSTNSGVFMNLLMHLNIDLGWTLSQQIDAIMAQMTVADLVAFLEPHLPCQDWAAIYGMMFTSGSFESTNLLLSIPGIKACIKNAFTQQEMMDALVIHFGMVNLWTKIFTVEPGTEITYLPALRNANKRLFLYQSMLLLNSNTDMRYFIENHTEPNTTVAEWKTAVKKSFGLNYYNDMMLEILEQYATFYWVYELQEQYMYGSSRLGSVQRNLPLVQQVLNSDSLIYYSYSNDSVRYMERGQKRFELSNHLGNVLAVVTDRKLVHCSNDELMWFEAQIVSVTDYYPFGSEIKERTYSVSSYRYGFGNHEKIDEVSGSGNTIDMGDRWLDVRLGRTHKLDRHKSKYPAVSPYAYSLNSPLLFNDPDGKDAVVTVQKDPNGGGKIIIASTIYITGKGANEFNTKKYTQKAAQLYQPGSYTNEKGEKYEIVYDVKFEYAPDKSKIQKQDGDNILEYNEENIRSHVKGKYQADVDGEGNISNVKRFTGNEGEIGKLDAIGLNHRATIHETLHFLGLSDRYEDDASGESQPDKGFEKDVMGSYYGTQMNQIHYDNIGKAYSGKEAGNYILKERVDTRSSDGALIGGSSEGQRPIPEAKKE